MSSMEKRVLAEFGRHKAMLELRRGTPSGLKFDDLCKLLILRGLPGTETRKSFDRLARVLDFAASARMVEARAEHEAAR